MVAEAAASIELNTADLTRGLARMPEVMTKHLKDGLERVMLGYRKDFFKHTGAKLKGGRRGLKNFRFWPVEVRGNALDNLTARIHTSSPAAERLETGGTFTGKGHLLALPLSGSRTATGRRRAGFGSPAAARKRGKEFVTIKRNGKLLLYDVLKSKGGKLGAPAFILIQSVHQRPILGFYKEWNSSNAMAARIRRLNISIGRAIKEIFGADATESVA